ncbi:MAG: hypothetical protein ABI175_20605, partial [Polyangiales bacterium]
MKVLRTIGLVLLALGAAFSVLYLQHRFDVGDRKSALRVLDEYHAPTTKQSIPDVLKKKHPDASIMFSATTESSCFQRIRVFALVVETDENGAVKRSDYQFLVDINMQHIGPGNPLGEQAIRWLDEPVSFSAAPSGSTSPSASASAPPSASASAFPSAPA